MHCRCRPEPGHLATSHALSELSSCHASRKPPPPTSTSAPTSKPPGHLASRRTMTRWGIDVTGLHQPTVGCRSSTGLKTGALASMRAPGCGTRLPWSCMRQAQSCELSSRVVVGPLPACELPKLPRAVAFGLRVLGKRAMPANPLLVRSRRPAPITGRKRPADPSNLKVETRRSTVLPAKALRLVHPTLAQSLLLAPRPSNGLGIHPIPGCCCWLPGLPTLMAEPRYISSPE